MGDEITIIELVRDYAVHCRSYYGTSRNSELWQILTCCKPIQKLYKTLPAVEFGPRQFKAVREEMIEADWARTTINQNMKRIVRMFKWAAAEEKLPASIFETLRLIPSLKAYGLAGIGQGGATTVLDLKGDSVISVEFTSEGTGPGSWQYFRTGFTADSGTTDVAFLAKSPGNDPISGMQIDYVELRAIPEPGLGIASLALPAAVFIRRRRK